MRDINRIEPTLAALGALWKTHPDWRLMQLICNLQREMGNDLFYVEDDRLVRIINEIMADKERRNG